MPVALGLASEATSRGCVRSACTALERCSGARPTPGRVTQGGVFRGKRGFMSELSLGIRKGRRSRRTKTFVVFALSVGALLSAAVPASAAGVPLAAAKAEAAGGGSAGAVSAPRRTLDPAAQAAGKQAAAN